MSSAISQLREEEADGLEDFLIVDDLNQIASNQFIEREIYPIGTLSWADDYLPCLIMIFTTTFLEMSWHVVNCRTLLIQHSQN